MPSLITDAVSGDEENITFGNGLEHGTPAYDQAVMDWATPKPVPQRHSALSHATGRSSSFSDSGATPLIAADSQGLVRRATYNDIFYPGETPVTSRGVDEINRLGPSELARRNTSADVAEVLSRERTLIFNTLTAEKRSNSWSALVKQSCASSESVYSQKSNQDSAASSPTDSAYGSDMLTQGLQQRLAQVKNNGQIYNSMPGGLLQDHNNVTGSNGLHSTPASVATVAPNIKSDSAYSWQGSSHGSFRETDLSSVSQPTMTSSIDQTGVPITSQYDSSQMTSQSNSQSFTAIGLPQACPGTHSTLGGHTVYIPNQQSQQMLLIQQPVLANAGTSSGSIHVDTSLNQQDVNQWEALVKAKETMLRQKDQMIEKQKKAISELQQRQLEQDSRLFHARSHTQPQNDMMTMRIQELQFENGQLRGQIADVVNKKDMEVNNMRKKLGEREYEIVQFEGKFQDMALGQSNEIEILQEKMSEKEKQMNSLLVERENAKEKEKELRGEVEKLKAYLNDVPTTDEHKKVVKEFKDLREDYKKLKEVATAQQKKIADLKRALSNKSSTAKKLEEEKKELQEKSQHLEKAVDSYKKGGAVSELEVEEAKWETERTKTELDRYKKLLENKHKKIKELHEKSQATQKNLEERLGQEEDTVNALRADLQSKEETLEDLRKSLKKLASQNQDLMELNMNLEDTCKEHEKANSKEVTDAHRRLQYELTKCISDLKGLVELCTARKEGEDPNMSALLGLRRPSLVEYDEEFDSLSSNRKGDALSEVNAKLSKIKKIQSEVDNLRSFLSDKYAEDIGDQCYQQ